MSDHNPDDTDTDGFASPPCGMQAADPAYFGLEEAPPDWPAVDAWRKARRKTLLAERRQLSAETRRARSAAIIDGLSTILKDDPDAVIAAYWPMRGEPDLRPWMRETAQAGMCLVLPVIVEKWSPLAFRAWAPGSKMKPGVWYIPEPADGTPLTPTVVIAPLVGFDRDFYRLGHGGGYYDRTLAALRPRPLAIGVGYSDTALETIYPQDHDIPMDYIVTEKEIRRRG